MVQTQANGTSSARHFALHGQGPVSELYNAVTKRKQCATGRYKGENIYIYFDFHYSPRCSASIFFSILRKNKGD